MAFQTNCPRCGTKGVAFHFLGQHRFIDDTFGRGHYDVSGVCGVCNRVVVFTFRVESHDPDPIQWTVHGSHIPAEYCIEVAPVPPSTDAPRHTPENVASFFRQGKESVNQGSWDAAGMMFRKTLETGLKAKFPEVTSSLTPYERIEKAAKLHKLTPDLAEWSHRIRNLGNDATHEEEPFTETQAREIADFTRIVLEYLFTYPEEVKAARSSAAAARNSANVST